MMMDFINHGSRDPYLFVNYSNSYLNFVTKVDYNETVIVSDKAKKILELLSKEINNAKRIEETILLKLLIEKGNLLVNDFISFIYENYGYVVSATTIDSIIRNLNFEFVREKSKGKLLSVREIYNINIITFENGVISFDIDFTILLEELTFKNYLLDSIAYAIYTFDVNFNLNKWNNGFVLYNKYSRKDVFRILNAKENPVAQNVGGYQVSSDSSYCPIFVNYHKEDNISESTKYEDEFVNNK